MAEAFDPYHRWLGIPPKDQPPNYYRLLGLGKFESDAEVIAAAADRAAQYVSSCAQPPYDKVAGKLVERIGRAKATLLDPTARATYDSRLRSAAAGTLSSSTGATPAAPVAKPAAASGPNPVVRAKAAPNATPQPVAPQPVTVVPVTAVPVSKTTLQHLRHAKPIAEAVPSDSIAPSAGPAIAKVQLVQPVAVAVAPAFIATEPEVTPSSYSSRKKSKSSKGSKSAKPPKSDKKKSNRPAWLIPAGLGAVVLILLGVGVYLLTRPATDSAKTASRKASPESKKVQLDPLDEAPMQAAAPDLAVADAKDSSAIAAVKSAPVVASAEAAGTGDAPIAAAPAAQRKQAASGLQAGGSPLMELIASGGSTPRLEQALKEGVDLETKDKLGRTALRLAAMADRLDLVTALLAAKASANTADARGETPLMSAAQVGNLKMVEALLAAGAEPNAKTIRGAGDAPAGLSALLVAARHGQAEVAKALIAKGATVDQANRDGVTPLMAAAVAGDLKTVDALLIEKANLTATDKIGQTPLMFATHGGNAEVVELLLKNGAMANARTHEQVSALSIAIDAKNAKLAEILRESAKKEVPVLDF